MRRLLLVNPDFDADFTSYGAIAPYFLGKKAFMAPLPLATLAALTPGDIEVVIWDEPVHGRVDRAGDPEGFDLVGVTGYLAHAHRARQIARFFRARGTPVVVGGPGASAAPEAYRSDFDVLFVGEAEHTWPRFLADWQSGEPRREYRQITKPDLATSPPPSWASLAGGLKPYFVGAVQTTRGCPFDCEFCDVIFLYGRQPRHKPIGSVIEEVRHLERLGVEKVFFCDDNFIGDPRYSRELLRELIRANGEFDRPLSFATQITLNVAKDESMLELLADANFSSLYIGVETPNKDSLRETNKPQNYRTDIVEDVRRIHSYGLPVRAGMVVGFDHDGRDIFRRQLEFLREACIPVATFNMLKAPPGTRLWLRLQREGRVIAPEDGAARTVDDMTYAVTNIIPRQMTRVELMEGFKSLLEGAYTWGDFTDRVLGFVSSVRRPPRVPRPARYGADDGDFLRRLFHTLGDREAICAILGILSHTQQTAPFLMDKVFGLILQFIGVAEMGKAIGRELDRQIEASRSAGATVSGRVHRPRLVPESFYPAYEEIFDDVCEDLDGALLDKSRLPASLVEVFTDFLARWGETFEGLDEHHRAAFREIVGRTVAAANHAHTAGEAAYPGESVSGARDRRQLKVETLKCVERDLRWLGEPLPVSSATLPRLTTPPGAVDVTLTENLD